MSDISTIKDVTLIDFEGIENITKFKYRTTIPKYPKPGTFYWIEQHIKGEPKFGIYFTTNDGELRRLDSKIYELVVRDEDGYIQITESDDFDKQEIYLIIGTYKKEDDIIDGQRVFRITAPENKGLATVEETVDYVSDSNNMLYMSNVPDWYRTGKRLGDIRFNKGKEDLKNHNISEILDTIIYPTLQPIITNPNVTISDKVMEGMVNNHILIKNTGSNEDFINQMSDIFNKFSSFDNLKEYVTCSRGDLSRDGIPYVTAEPNENGEEWTLNYYAGKPVFDSVHIFKDVPYGTDSENNNYFDGTYNFSIEVLFEDGYEPRDNKRRRARYEDKIDSCTCQDVHKDDPEYYIKNRYEYDIENGCELCYVPAFEQQYVKSNIISVDVVYPIYANCLGENVKYIKDGVVEYKDLINYNVEGGGVVYMEFPNEIDGYDTTQKAPCKMSLYVPEHLQLKVYQYNEFTKEYDVEVSIVGDGTMTLNNAQYIRYIRCPYPELSLNNDKNKKDTHVVRTTYKITINKQ